MVTALALAQAALSQYDLPPHLDLLLINVSENATFKLEAADGRRWAMRVHRDGYHSHMAIVSELRWLMDLRAADIAITPRPVAGRDGELVQIVGQGRFVVVFEWEAGVEPDIHDDLAVPFERLGEIAAGMHQFSRQWKKPDWFTRFTWNFETALGDASPHWGRWRDGMGVDQPLLQLFERTVSLIGKRLAIYGEGPERFGMVHADLRLANLLVDGDTVKVIDFDDSGFSWFMYDAATPVSFYEHEAHVPQLIEHWKTGYRRVAPLSKADEAEIPTFVMLRRLLLVAWIGTRRETELAQSMGVAYTQGTAALCEAYLRAASKA
jgi:Ser/Thr protein kinase RdoA (MazF antagonist)